jgi:protease II
MVLDLTNCAKGITNNKLLCAEFESAGALIGGVMINEYPDLFAGIVLRYF